MAEAPRTTRLAPSPTGALHLGNARTFLVNWALARQRGWRVRLRVEDWDTPRIKPWATEQALADLAWLGLDWDEAEPLFQSEDRGPYEAARDRLWRAGLLYPCACTRRDIQAAASAPHGGERRYPGTCRPAGAAQAPGPSTARRFRAPPGPESFDDAWAGPQAVDVQAEVGDFVVWTKADAPAYQLAVVVDDIRQDVTDVVRGDDLLGSAARQSQLYRALGAAPPRWWHLPLVRGDDGRRLAKRHGDTRLSQYREAGVPAARVRGLLAYWCGLHPRRVPFSVQDFLEAFDPARVPESSITYTEEDDAWLRGL
jgi:glutamyl-tRNA synthetase